MRGFACFAIVVGTLLAGSLRGAEPSKNELAQKAQTVLRAHCYSCHGEGGQFEGGMGYILEPEKLIAHKKVVPGEPEKSPIYVRVLKGAMPPADAKSRPSEAEKLILKQWIEAGAPHESTTVARKPILREDEFRKMLEDLETLDRRQRRFIRYFSIAQLYNQGLSDDELQTYRNAISKLVNSLSWHPKITNPLPVDEHKTLLRIDLRWFMWDANSWNRLLNDYPYGILDDSVSSRAVLVGTATKMPVLRGDWFVATASRAPLYYDLLQLPASLPELERQLRVDTAVNIQQERAYRLGFNGSGVSKNNRILERHDSIHGAYWRTYDFEGVPQNLVERGGLLPDKRNIFAYPLGPTGTGTTESFQNVAGEAIFNLPNGLHAFMLVNANNVRQEKGNQAIVSDPKRPDRAVEAGVSCMSCHLTGINPKTDQVRDFVAKNPKAFSRADAEIIRALYIPEKKMAKIMQEDAERYRKAVEATGAKISKTEPVSTLTIRYEADMDLPTAAAEAGFAPEVFKQHISASELLVKNLGALRLPGGTISRQVFVQAFGDIVRDLKLGTLFTAGNNSGLLADNTGELDPLEGPATQANAVAFSRDGRKALIASADRSLRLWDIQAERDLRRFVGHTASVWSAAFNHDETLALSGGMDGTVRLWDLSTSHEIKRFDGHLTLVSAVAFLPDGKRALSGGYDGTIIMWDLNGTELKRYEGLGKYVYALTVSPDGKKALAAIDKRAVLLNLDAEPADAMIQAFRVEDSAPMVSVAFSPDGKRFAEGRASWVGVGALDPLMPVQAITGLKSPVRDIAFAPSGKALLIGLADHSVVLWDIDNNKQLAKFEKHAEQIVKVAFVQGGKQTLSASHDSAIKSWSMAKFEAIVTQPAAENNSGGNSSGSPPPTPKLQPIAKIPAGGTVGNLVLSPNKKWLFFLNRSEEKLVQIDTSSLRISKEWRVPEGCAVFTLTRDGKSLWTYGADRNQTTLFELDPVALSVRKRFSLTSYVYDLAAGDKDYVFLSGEGGGWTEITVVDAKRESAVGHWGGVWTRSLVQLSPDGTRLLTATQGVNLGKIESYPIPVKLDEKPNQNAAQGTPDSPLGGPFTIAPDGQYLISRSGVTLKLSSNRTEDLQQGPKLPPHIAVTVDPARGIVFLLATDGLTLKQFSYPEMKWQKSWTLESLAHEAAFDSKTGRLYLAVIDPQSLRDRPRARGHGDIHVFEMKNLPAEKQ
ncbi:MAG TPA: c-type cytochrome domain-containing protein [Gemmataceae bacterium]|nr:c-type cytochrome domain-containing protein [Gemmataceae bacterium]